MKNLKYSIVLFLFFCSVSFLNAQDNSATEATFTGKWTLTGISAYAPPGTLPEYKAGDYIWDFGDGKGYQMTISHNDAVERDRYAPGSGDYPVWNRNCLLKIGKQTYRYQFEGPGSGGKLDVPANPDGSPAKLQLYLDTNLDPRLPDGGYVLILTKL